MSLILRMSYGSEFQAVRPVTDRTFSEPCVCQCACVSVCRSERVQHVETRDSRVNSRGSRAHRGATVKPRSQH